MATNYCLVKSMMATGDATNAEGGEKRWMRERAKTNEESRRKVWGVIIFFLKRASSK